MNESKVTTEPVLALNKREAEYLIIGGGAAGFSAIQAIKEADPEAKVYQILFNTLNIFIFCV